MDTTSEYDHLTVTEAYAILEPIKDAWMIGNELQVPTYTWYQGCVISNEKYQVCKKKIQWNDVFTSTYAFKSTRPYDKGWKYLEYN